MNKPDLNDDSIEELEAKTADLMRQRAVLIDNQRTVAQVLEDKRKAKALAEDMEKMKQRHGIALQVKK